MSNIRRLFTLSEQQLDDLRTNGQRRTGRALPNLALWYQITLKPEVDSVAFIETLRGAFNVDVAEYKPLPAPPPATTPPFRADQGYLDAATDGIDAEYAWTILGGDGTGITIYDVEYNWLQSHEDLTKASGVTFLLGPGDSIDPPGYPGCPAPCDALNREHGTAVLGELIANRDAVGVTGIAWGANIGLAPSHTTNLGLSIDNAIILAAADGKAGDVILVEQQGPVCNLPDPSGSGANYGPVEWTQSIFDSIQTATANGVVVVEAAGNGGVDLDQAACGDAFDRTVRDSGAIIVGAGQSPSTGSDRERSTFSTYGDRVDVQGWGDAITTTGYGNSYQDPDDPDNADRWYTNSFGGTSGASPMAAGAVASIQGIALNRSGTELSPLAVRQLLINTGSVQQGNTAEKIGPRPNLRLAIEQYLSAAVDVSLIIDSSGSMSSNDPSGMRKEGAKVFVDTAQNGDGIAVVDFATTAFARWPMTPLTNDRTAVKAAIDQIPSNGSSTNIGGGLQVGYDQLQAGNADHEKAAVLMTDGQHNAGTNPLDVLPLYQAAGWPIYTIGLGSGVNQQLLQQIADSTGGSYFQLSNPNDLIPVYFEIVGAILGGTTLINQQNLLQQGETVEATVAVPANQSQVTFLVNWPGSRVDTTLTTPTGQQITPQTADPNVYHAQGLTYELYRITNPQAGNWIVTMYGADLPTGGEMVELTVSAIGSTVAPSPLVCNGDFESFDSGIPTTGWSVTSQVAGGPEWTTLSNCGPYPNWTNGTGDAACVTAGNITLQPFDTELRSPQFSLTGMSSAYLNYQANYQNWASQDWLDLDISSDGGVTWTTLRSWQEDHGAPFGLPGENVTINLMGYVGESNLMVRWRYYAPTGQGLGYYAQLDDVRLNCTEIPPTAVIVSEMTSATSQSPLPAGSLPLAGLPAAAGLAFCAVAWLRRKR